MPYVCACLFCLFFLLLLFACLPGNVALLVWAFLCRRFGFLCLFVFSSSSFFLVLAFVLPFRLFVSRACFVDLFFFGLFRFGFLWLFLFSSCACVVLKEGRGLFVPVLLSTRSCREARVCCWVSCCCFVAKWLPGLALSF